MPVRVLEWFVAVEVGMARARRDRRIVLVAMVEVVGVRMFMERRCMPMRMHVLLGQMEPQAGEHQQAGQHQQRGHWCPEQDGEYCANERRH